LGYGELTSGKKRRIEELFEAKGILFETDDSDCSQSRRLLYGNT
jgi:hypothetical protein